VKTFSAAIKKIGINPYVPVPPTVLRAVFEAAERDKGPIPVSGTIDGHPFVQTLVKYSGDWRLYINTPMMRASGKKEGDTVMIALAFDAAERPVPMHPQLEAALKQNPAALERFRSCTPSLQKEIKRYIHHLKSAASVEKNVALAIGFLTGRQRWIGRAPLPPATPSAAVPAKHPRRNTS